MELTTIVGALVLIGLLFFLVSFAVAPAGDDSTVIFEASRPGDRQESFAVALPRSFNQPEGQTYSYTAWVLLKDFTTGYGTRRRIFSKQDSPGVYLDSTSNSLVVAIDTYGATETILIPNLSAMKWIHLALVVDQHSVDIYINGILRKHHTLSQLPQLNDAAVTIGGGWNGVIARLTYYARSLSYVDIKELVKQPVPDDLERKASGPNYFDITWYIGRLYSA
jgi:hypothetical protein